MPDIVVNPGRNKSSGFLKCVEGLILPFVAGFARLSEADEYPFCANKFAIMDNLWMH